MKTLRAKLTAFFAGLFGKRRPAEKTAETRSPEQAARHG